MLNETMALKRDLSPGGHGGSEQSQMNPLIDTRPAVAAEYERLSALWKGVEYLHHRGSPDIFRQPDEGWPTRSAVESLLAGPDSTILIAETNGEIVGFVTLQVHRVTQTPRMRKRRFVMIENMGVDPLSSIPIVAAVVGDPVGSGLVDSLARPGGNLTALSVVASEMAVKRLEILR